METVILYHNPNCSKSRAALDLLENQPSISLKVIPYVTQPLSGQTLLELKTQLNMASLRDMMRVNDDLYHELKLDEADEATLLAQLLKHPLLMQRPIIQSGSKAVMGRPLENIQAFIDGDYEKA
ncbi:arsenate reductase (glutaredoxin) [Neisseriaceae bacterium ESL0693]|nr:arsenate reductase (glutaredoxin) [Neisseriaceae bacterium ESL0693]